MRLLEAVARWWRRYFPEQSLGRRGEAAAARFLRRRGYKILARGERLPMGELDLVALDRDTIVFVEVKTRRSATAGSPALAVNASKQQKLTVLALSWLKRRGLLNHSARFDIIAIVWPEGRWRPKIEHFPNAFPATGRGGFFS